MYIDLKDQECSDEIIIDGAILYKQKNLKIEKEMLRPGDILINKAGYSPCKVCWVSADSSDRVYVIYLASGYSRWWDIQKMNLYRPEEPEEPEGFEEPEELLTQEEEKTMKVSLYKFVDDKGVENFGEKVGVDRQGFWILEVAGAGYVAVDSKKVEKVIPYSVGVKFHGGNTTVYHFWTKEGTVKNGDLLILEDYSNIAIVCKLDTKSSKANKYLKGRIIQTTEIDSVEEENESDT